MTSKDQNDQKLQDYLQGKDAISEQYRKQSDQVPPDHIDAAILTSSRNAVAAGQGKRPGLFAFRLDMPFAIAAVVVLSVLVVFNIPREETTIIRAPLLDTDDAGVRMQQSATRMGSDGSESGAAAENNLVPFNTGTVPLLGADLASDIAEAAARAVAPELDMAGSVAAPSAPRAFRDETFAAEAAAAIRPELQIQTDEIEGRSRVLLQAVESRSDIDVNDQVTALSLAGEATDPGATLTECTSPRPEVCTFEYLPVCAVRDTGIRCVTTPCDSTELVQYGNACAACSDPDVIGYTQGECMQ
jgi:hypothetical protein